jgi:hypothetical protein
MSKKWDTTARITYQYDAQGNDTAEIWETYSTRKHVFANTRKLLKTYNRFNQVVNSTQDYIWKQDGWVKSSFMFFEHHNYYEVAGHIEGANDR